MNPIITILSASSLLHGRDLEALAGDLGAAFGGPVATARIEPDFRGAWDPDRGQYHSTMLLAALAANPDPGTLVCVVDVDLFIPVLTFVFGEAELGGRAAIVSTHRLTNQFYGLPADGGLLLERVRKEVVHEAGHTFGLLHCRQFECVMRSSTDVGEIDLKRPTLCRECASALAGLSGQAGRPAAVASPRSG